MDEYKVQRKDGFMIRNAKAAGSIPVSGIFTIKYLHFEELLPEEKEILRSGEGWLSSLSRPDK